MSWEKVNVPDHERADRWRSLVGVPWGQQGDTQSKLDDVFGVGTEREESFDQLLLESFVSRGGI